jgi:hypothetical protein
MTAENIRTNVWWLVEEIISLCSIAVSWTKGANEYVPCPLGRMPSRTSVSAVTAVSLEGLFEASETTCISIED